MSNFIEQAWYNHACWLKIFRPVSTLFRWLVKRRRVWALNNAAYVAPVPVIVVGNISVGGTGKTPVVLALIDLLREQGYHPGVVSRGYGAKPPSYPWSVELGQHPSHAGDEPLLISHRSGAPVIIDPDRPAAVKYLLAEYDCDIVISDDGLQHYALGRDIEIAILDGVRGLGNGRCLPEGPLREPPERLNDVDILLQNGGVQLQHPQADVFTLSATQIKRLNDHELWTVGDWISHQEVRKVHAVCAIGHPDRFYHTLERMGLDYRPHSFPDHHLYSLDELTSLSEYPIMMTEKDAVKCTDFSLTNAWVLQVRAELSDKAKKNVLQHVAACQFKEGKRNG